MKIVFYDGYCSLCSTSVDWLVRFDRLGELKFASLQGQTAAKLLVQKLGPLDFDTVIYLKDDKLYERSAAVLHILSDIGGFWGVSKMLLCVPELIRDLVYNFVAKNRYRVLKKRDSCRLPTPEEAGRFLE